ncbi:MAG: hypothetical protein K0S29_1164, partial [Gammaproteobacteria bacterium]|nr:hypothetical protein [Gammaproteobacteria bacterium]
MDMNIKQHIEDTMASRPKTSSFNLSSQNLTDSDIEALVPLLKKYPQIAELDLSHNKLNAKSAALLAQNKTLRKLKLYEGNSISIDDLRPFLENSHLIYLPIRGGSGSLLTEIREHIKKNGQAAAAPV